MSDILIDSFGFVSILVFCYMTVWFLIALVLKRNDVADIAWGIGFVLVAVVLYVKGGVVFDRGFLATLLVLIWGTRLSYHIFRRNSKKPEDRRYAAWRVEWGNWFVLRSYLQIFMLQGVLLILVVSPVIIINTLRGAGGAWNLLDVLGLAVWMFGFYFESVGDRQLRNFLSNPENKGKILNTGLWKYTRHPNYFGEVTQWWGLGIIALSVPFGWLGLVGPLTITFLILKVSGVPMLEKSMAENPLFDEYRKTTSMFLPRFFK